MAALRRAGLPVVAIEPDRRVIQAMGLNPLDARPRGAVSRITYASVARWLGETQEGRGLAAVLAGGGRPARKAGRSPGRRLGPRGPEDGRSSPLCVC